MVVGPNVPGVYANPERVRLVAELGVTLLVFSIGLEFNFRRLMRLAPTAGLVALIQAAAMTGLGYLVGRLMGLLRIIDGASEAVSIMHKSWKPYRRD
jgi:CPA2 family monovalent cation:H+ antiporter-2